MNKVLYFRHHVHYCISTRDKNQIRFWCVYKKRRLFINVMVPKKVDRRVQRTRRHLGDALMTLILEKGYDAVTIEDITERADLGRTTFYLHYKDKEDLLIKSLESVFDDLTAQIQLMSAEQRAIDQQEPLVLAFQHAAENARLYQIILSGQGGTSLNQRIREYIAGIVGEILSAQYADQLKAATVPLNILTNYIANSLMGMIAWWLESDQPYSVEEMIYYFRLLNNLGVAKALGIQPPDDAYTSLPEAVKNTY